MKTYRVWYNNGAAILVDASSAEEAEQMAKDQAKTDGYGGLKIKKVECLS